MTIRFIHTSDWHIAKPFANLPPDLAGELAAARLSAIPRIAAIARARGIAHVLVAGDSFDNDKPANATLRRTLEHLRAEADIKWHLLPGNHDAARSGGLWDRIARLGLPQNVIGCLEPKAIEIGEAAAVLPAPLTSKAPGRDPTEWMEHAVSPPGVLRIGLAHGSVQGFGSEGESSVRIAGDRAARANLAYLALGDWHGTKSIGARTWYSGTPEPDRFPDNEPGQVLAVTLDGAALPRVEKVVSAQFAWAKLSASVRALADLEAIERAAGALSAEPQRLLLKLTMSGALTLPENAALGEWRERLEGRLRYLDIDTDALAVAVSSGDLESLGAAGVLRAAANRLAASASDPRNPDQAIAKLALLRLFAFAAETREGEQ